MLRVSEIKLPLDRGPDALKSALLKKLRLSAKDLVSFTVFKRGVDARKKSAILYAYIVDAEVADETDVLRRVKNDPHVTCTPNCEYPGAARAPLAPFLRPVVIGAGPCGLFAGLILAQAGYRPIILERGKVVRERTKDTWGLWRKSVLNPESNVQFGEGGAGTFSDGKLYSQIKDPRHLGRKVLTEFVKAGAPQDILTEAHPHIGTFRLVTMVESLRETIEKLGGEYRFGSRVTNLELDKARQVRGVVLASGERIVTSHVVLAPGHSARDVFQMLYDLGVDIEAKRSPSASASSIRSRSSTRRAMARRSLNSARRSTGWCITRRTGARSTVSACARAGTVVAATSEEGRVATNGMSQYSRKERNANAGIVVGITPEDYPEHVLAGIDLQRKWEARAFETGGGPTRRRHSAWAISLAEAFDRTGRGDAVVSPGVHLTTCRIACRTTRSRRSARRFPRSGVRSRALRWTMRF